MRRVRPLHSFLSSASSKAMVPSGSSELYPTCNTATTAKGQFLRSESPHRAKWTTVMKTRKEEFHNT